MSESEQIADLRLRARPSEPVTLSIPLDTLELVRRVAATRDMEPEALLRFYVGQGLRRDASALFSERLLATTAQVLARHIDSEERRTAILQEIRIESAA
jgi:hypothetical protein